MIKPKEWDIRIMYGKWSFMFWFSEHICEEFLKRRKYRRKISFGNHDEISGGCESSEGIASKILDTFLFFCITAW